MAELDPAYGRGVELEIKYDGQPLRLKTERVESLNYTDNASGSVDDLTLVLDTRDGAVWEPEKGKDLDVTLKLNNWYINGEQLSYHCGNFCIDDISLSGGPSRMTVKAIAQPAASGFKEQKNTKTWQKVTIEQIAREIMARYGMPWLIYNAATILIEELEQSEEPDSEFLKKVCEKYGLFLKVYKNGFVIFDEQVYMGNGAKTFFGIWPTVTPDFDVMEWPLHEIKPNWSWNTTLQRTYTGAKLKYTSSKKGKDIEVVVGSGERLLHLSERAESQADAERIAKNRLNQENRKQVTMTISPNIFNPFIDASNVIEMRYMGRCNGLYFIDRVSVTLNASGLQETFSMHRQPEKI